MTKNHLNNIFLIGFMASGKTTLGKKISKHLGFDFIDTDKYISRKYNKSIAQIFKEKGEEVFRNYEIEALNEVLKSSENKVIATGGGMPCNQHNLDLMLQNGTVVFLELDLKSIQNRVKASKTKRPILNNLDDEALSKKIETLYEQRIDYYKQAHLTISALNIRSIDLKELSANLLDFHK